MHARYAGANEGKVADYIPELAKADPNWFGICVVTADGQIFEVGDYQQLFTIQSISKPFVFGLALEDHGREQVLAKVSVEPTGEAFNSIVLDEATNRPFNPLVNAGAIATADLIEAKTSPSGSRGCWPCSAATSDGPSTSTTRSSCPSAPPATATAPSAI